VRQAISYAIDREAIVKEIYYGEAIATDNQIPRATWAIAARCCATRRTATSRRPRS
jgi:ABC-type transport system substrate-binding protein